MRLDYELNNNLEITSSGRIQLKNLEKNLIFYASYDVNGEADFSKGDSSPLMSSTTSVITADGPIPFGKALNGDTNTLLYKKENFSDLTTTGSISMWCNFYQLNRNSGDTVIIFEVVDTNLIGDTNNNNYKIEFLFNSDKFNLRMYGDTGALIINDLIDDVFTGVDNYTHLELNWNKNLHQIFINGEQKNESVEGITRSGYGSLIIHLDPFIKIDDLLIKNKYSNIENFDVPTNKFSKYPVGNPFQEIPLGDSFEENKILGIDIEGDSSLKFILKHGDTYYNIVNNFWQPITNTDYSESNSVSELRNNIPNFPFIKTNQVRIKTFFPSDGLKQVYLDKLVINKDLTGVLNVNNYNDVMRYIRSKLGDPIIPVELTNEQLSDCIDDAIYYYGRYKNTKEEMEIFNLSGTWAEGWDLPDKVKEEDIIEIFVDSAFPFAYYSGRTDIISNLYAQYIFQNPGTKNLSTGIADYRISLMALRDYAVLLGTQVKWLILGRKLKIWPKPPGSSKIGIRYASQVIAEDVLKDNLFRELALAKAKIVLGNIRSTFSGGIPGGEENIQLNGESLLSEGKQEEQTAIEKLIKAQEPLLFDFF